MAPSADDLRGFLAAHPRAIVAELTGVRGSTPREAGTFMLISSTTTVGTIGGGALEHLVIDRARQVLRSGETSTTLDIPLGPEIGQCCGGRVDVAMRVVTPAAAAKLVGAAEDETAVRPHVYLFGSGHVGHALARALSFLPLHVHVVDTRPDELAGLPANVEAIASPMPEAVVRAAPIGSSYVILTHDHALDFMIALEALKRTDSSYVGMVGSRTKRAKFSSWFLAEGGHIHALERLVLPIGGTAYPGGLGDKRPEVIAALAAAEIMVHIGSGEATSRAANVTRASSGAADGR
jgi:xanthine dehydrogenase accessory factor